MYNEKFTRQENKKFTGMMVSVKTFVVVMIERLSPPIKIGPPYLRTDLLSIGGGSAQSVFLRFAAHKNP
jgi:hypothetical protein